MAQKRKMAYLRPRGEIKTMPAEISKTSLSIYKYDTTHFKYKLLWVYNFFFSIIIRNRY